MTVCQTNLPLTPNDLANNLPLKKTALDNGPLKEKPEDVRELVNDLIGILDTNTTHEHRINNKLLLAFESIWLRVFQVRMILLLYKVVAIETKSTTRTPARAFSDGLQAPCEITARLYSNRLFYKRVAAGNDSG